MLRNQVGTVSAAGQPLGGSASGSASVNAPLWGARSHDWADIQQGMARPLFAAVLEETAVNEKTEMLDIGCGAGMLGAMAAERGACISGIDAAAPLIEIAAERTPCADFRVGEMETLPFPNDSFDVVTGINSFQFAADPVRALREARRVVRCGGQVVVATWGKAEECEAVAFLAALRPEGAPPSTAQTTGTFNLSEEAALAMIGQAGLQAVAQEDVAVPFDYPDLATALRGLLSTGPGQAAIASQGEEPVRRRVSASLESFRTPTGGYHLQNKFRYMVTRPV